MTEHSYHKGQPNLWFRRKKLRSAHHAGLLLLQVLIPFTLAIGQPGGGEDLDSNPDAAVPVDGGLSLLLAAGAAYGVERVKTRGVEEWRSEQRQAAPRLCRRIG